MYVEHCGTGDWGPVGDLVYIACVGGCLGVTGHNSVFDKVSLDVVIDLQHYKCAINLEIMIAETMFSNSAMITISTCSALIQPTIYTV